MTADDEPALLDRAEVLDEALTDACVEPEDPEEPDEPVSEGTHWLEVGIADEPGGAGQPPAPHVRSVLRQPPRARVKPPSIIAVNQVRIGASESQGEGGSACRRHGDLSWTAPGHFQDDSHRQSCHAHPAHHRRKDDVVVGLVSNAGFLSGVVRRIRAVVLGLQAQILPAATPVKTPPAAIAAPPPMIRTQLTTFEVELPASAEPGLPSRSTSDGGEEDVGVGVKRPEADAGALEAAGALDAAGVALLIGPGATGAEAMIGAGVGVGRMGTVKSTTIWASPALTPSTSLPLICC